jgi:hypothetical protein
MEANRIKQPLQSKNNQLGFWTRTEENDNKNTSEFKFGVKLFGEAAPFKCLVKFIYF